VVVITSPNLIEIRSAFVRSEKNADVGIGYQDIENCTTQLEIVFISSRYMDKVGIIIIIIIIITILSRQRL